MNESRSNTFRRKRKRRVFFILLLGILAIITPILWDAYSNIDRSLENIHNSISTNDKREGSQAVIDATDPISFAFLGVDNGAYGRGTETGRSDAIIVGTINPETKKTTLVSIPRDTYALMEGYETMDGSLFYDKLTHAYAFGEAEMAVNSIQELINIPIDYYVEINMQGLVDIVNAIGGIEVTSPLTFDYEEHYFVEDETYNLDGKEALAFARMRKTDPEGDFGRQRREKLVIEAIIDKVLSFDSIMNYQSILQTMEKNVKTNLTFDEITDLLSGYRGAMENISQENLIGEELWIDDIYYLYVNPEDRLELSNNLREELELDPIDMEDLELSDTDIYYVSPY